jgi:hypothetical protein
VTAGGASASSTVQVNCAPVVQQVVVQQVVARPAQGQVIYTAAPQVHHQPQPVIIQRAPQQQPVPSRRSPSRRARLGVAVRSLLWQPSVTFRVWLPRLP